MPVTPRPALGEVSNTVRERCTTAIGATPKSVPVPVVPSQLVLLSSHSESSEDDEHELEEVELLRKRRNSNDYIIHGGTESPVLVNLSEDENLIPSLASTSTDDGSDDDEQYPPMENMYIPTKAMEDFDNAFYDSFNEDMLVKVIRGSDIIPMCISASVFTHHTNAEFDYEDEPDPLDAVFDVSDCEL